MNRTTRKRAASSCRNVTVFSFFAGYIILRVIPSQANYFLCEITGKYTSAELSRLLLDRNILIKDCGTKKAFGGKNYIRIAVKNRDENNRLISILASFDL